ncbi:hypothetical protein BDF20DRAFT_27541 [Mycotypha africana]|uniref:uncharacterized protein n=1 Tax=Mycotypha africana TaxID=64632 RepID=UPI002300E344|nr:uncharacterized protein BDF20DRAFT_27541 [Mycotypha africana]KAI8991165.1 hypothetical protein BDF20DRAFT_27541 [Mycotypha africana]
MEKRKKRFFGSIVVSIPACHAGDRGSIPRRRVFLFTKCTSSIVFYYFIVCLVSCLKVGDTN